MIRPVRLWASALVLLVLGALLAVPRAQASPIYNGGPVMSGPNNVYYIWYGDWGADTATTILPKLISDLSGSAYMNVLSSYDSPTNAYAPFSNQVNYGGSVDVSSAYNTSIYTTYGTNLNGSTTTTFLDIVTAVLSSGAFAGYNASTSIFDVLTAPSITVTGFGTSFCGWHSSSGWGGSLGTQYGFIGDPTGVSGCMDLNTTSSPNNNVGADAMASVIAHELFETVTDPTGWAWWDSISPTGTGNTGGYENGDMCAWQFGNTYKAPNGSQANVNLNGNNYLLQQQWLNQGGGVNTAGGACVMGLATSAPQPAPEPWSLAILASALVGLGLVRRRAA